MDEKAIVVTLTGMALTVFDIQEIQVVPLPQSGSERRYFRIFTDNGSYIGTYVPDPVEGECFVRLARAFLNDGKAVPRIYAVSSCHRMYIQEDLGDVSLFSILGRDDAEEMVKDTLDALVSLQSSPEEIWSGECMCKPFDKRQIMWDLNYFKYEFLKPREVAFDENALEDDFEMISSRLSAIPNEFTGFMMRDCQSRNVMVTSGIPVFIDFQGGRKGPALYDAVSLLWQARAGFSRDFRMRMLDFYCDRFCDGDHRRKKRMLDSLGDIVLLRTLQVLGAYGFRGLVQKKPHFILSIPGGLANLRELLDSGNLDRYPELKRCAEALTEKVHGPREGDHGMLEVEIISFSFRKGYPADMSGNGGGFVFDCRSLHNPGRYQEYRTLTGRDRRVAEFLERRGEIRPFLENAWSLTDSAVERYLSRGFTHLQICFGCTGGHHRSVYCAERTARHIREVFPEAAVNLKHREHPDLN